MASVDTDTGEFQEKRLAHPGEAEKFYRELAVQGMKVRVGMESSGHARWFERLVAELQFDLWIGDAAQIRTKRVRKQKTDRQDAQLILRLLLEDRFPRIWVPSWENRDLRQLLWHRHRMVQARSRIMNQLQAVALNEGLRCKKKLWRERGRQQLESFRLAPWASRRRRDLLELLDRLNPTIAELSQAIEQEVEKYPEAQRLKTHPGVGPLTALGFVLIIGKAERFQCGKQVASYLGVGAAGRVERKPAPAGSHHQARKFDVAFLVGGGGPGDSAQPARVAKQVSSSDDPAETKNCQGRNGPQASSSPLLDDA
jgi:transposase